MNEKDLIKKYTEGSLSKKERHDLEKSALRDPFLMDALEGHEAMHAEIGGSNIGKYILAFMGVFGVVVGIGIMWWAVEFKEMNKQSYETNAESISLYSEEQREEVEHLEGTVLLSEEAEIINEMDVDVPSQEGESLNPAVGNDLVEDTLPVSNEVLEIANSSETSLTEVLRDEQPLTTTNVLNLNPYLSQTINEQKLEKIKAERDEDLSKKELKRILSHCDQVIQICEWIKQGKTTEADKAIWMYKKSSAVQQPYFIWMMALKELKMSKNDSAYNRLTLLSKEQSSLGLQARKLGLEVKAIK